MKIQYSPLKGCSSLSDEYHEDIKKFIKLEKNKSLIVSTHSTIKEFIGCVDFIFTLLKNIDMNETNKIYENAAAKVYERSTLVINEGSRKIESLFSVLFDISLEFNNTIDKFNFHDSLLITLNEKDMDLILLDVSGKIDKEKKYGIIEDKELLNNKEENSAFLNVGGFCTQYSRAPYFYYTNDGLNNITTYYYDSNNVTRLTYDSNISTTNIESQTNTPKKTKTQINEEKYKDKIKNIVCSTLVPSYVSKETLFSYFDGHKITIIDTKYYDSSYIQHSVLFETSKNLIDYIMTIFENLVFKDENRNKIYCSMYCGLKEFKYRLIAILKRKYYYGNITDNVFDLNEKGEFMPFYKISFFNNDNYTNYKYNVLNKIYTYYTMDNDYSIDNFRNEFNAYYDNTYSAEKSYYLNDGYEFKNDLEKETINKINSYLEKLELIIVKTIPEKEANEKYGIPDGLYAIARENGIIEKKDSDEK